MDGEWNGFTQTWPVIEIVDGLLSKWGRSWVKNDCLIGIVHFLHRTVSSNYESFFVRGFWRKMDEKYIPVRFVDSYYGVVICESVGPPCGFILIKSSLSWCLCIVHSVFSLFFQIISFFWIFSSKTFFKNEILWFSTEWEIERKSCRVSRLFLRPRRTSH